MKTIIYDKKITLKWMSRRLDIEEEKFIELESIKVEIIWEKKREK